MDAGFYPVVVADGKKILLYLFAFTVNPQKTMKIWSKNGEKFMFEYLLNET